MTLMLVRWRIAHSSISFLITIRGSPRKMSSSVSRQLDIYASINKYTLVCVSCHPLFHYGYIALCLPEEVFKYLVEYMEYTPAEEQMPFYQVCTRPSHVLNLQVGNGFSMNWPPPTQKGSPMYLLSCRSLGCTEFYTCGQLVCSL